MGNKIAVAPDPHVATFEEVMALPVKFKFEALGVDKEEAIQKLQKICEERGMPPLRLLPGFSDRYYCGIWTNNKKRSESSFYNPVFYGAAQDDVLALMWWNPNLVSFEEFHGLSI
jgi:hypothetical protein